MRAREGRAGEGPAGERPAGEGPGRLPCARTRAVASGPPQACVLCARCNPALGTWGLRRRGLVQVNGASASFSQERFVASGVPASPSGLWGSSF